jgi:hypothetical protein
VVVLAKKISQFTFQIMNFNKWLLVLIISTFCISIGCKEQGDITNLGEKTFIYKTKIYQLIDNELIQIADLSKDDIRVHNLNDPEIKNLDSSSLSFVKKGAYARLNVLYRGNFLYYKLLVEGINDLRENYYPGELTISLRDEYGFILHSTEIQSKDMVAVLDDSNSIDHFEFNGKTEINAIINSAISSFGASTTITRK